METAGVKPRFFALLCDTIVFFAGGLVIGIAMGALGITSGLATNRLVWIGVALAYYIAMEATVGGSLGKLFLGLRVVDEWGGRLSWGQALVRNVLRPVDSFLFGLVGVAFISSSEHDQRLGDRAARAFVVPVEESSFAA